jgi:transposase-like protein
VVWDPPLKADPEGPTLIFCAACAHGLLVHGELLSHVPLRHTLDVPVQSRRDKKAAKRLLRKLLRKQERAPRALIPDKLKSHSAAKWEIMPSVEHRQHKGLNNREFPPIDATTGADHEAVQVASAGATVSVYS